METAEPKLSHYQKYCKPFRDAHPEKVKEYNARMYAKHHEKMRAHQREKVMCEVCGFEVSRGGLDKHRKSKEHCAKAGTEWVKTPWMQHVEEQIPCPLACGLSIRRGNLARHLRSKRYHPEEQK